MEKFILLRIGQAGFDYVYQVGELGPDGAYTPANRKLPENNHPVHLEEARRRLDYARQRVEHETDCLCALCNLDWA